MAKLKISLNFESDLALWDTENRIQAFWGFRLTDFAFEWIFLALSDTADSMKHAVLPTDQSWGLFLRVPNLSQNQQNP